MKSPATIKRIVGKLIQNILSAKAHSDTMGKCWQGNEYNR